MLVYRAFHPSKPPMLLPSGHAARFVADGYVLCPAPAHLSRDVSQPVQLTATHNAPPSAPSAKASADDAPPAPSAGAKPKKARKRRARRGSGA